MSMPMEFAFGDNPVRVVLVDGEPWWVAGDVAVVLEYRDASNMARNLDEDERGTQIVSTPSKNQHGDFGTAEQEMLVINESGLYSAILRSRKASAKRFKKWVTAEVLPSIRKHGSYVMPPAADEQEPTPMAAHIEADQVVSAGRVFRSLFTTGRSMGMPRRLAATRANSAAERATGVDLAAELGASNWLEGPDLPEPQRKHYELQQRIRTHLAANSWPSGFSGQQLIEALGLINDKPTQMAVGRCLGLLGYQRQRMPAPTPNGIRPWGYRLNTLPVV